jgi:hypothetical protein
MKEQTLHIIAFDTPYPPNYGGIVDIYYKLRTLKSLGVNIILHSFYKEEKDIKRLKELCQEVHLYKRKQFNLLNLLPYIVSSRMSLKLIKRLKKDKHPILIEGIHCTGFLLRLLKRNRKIGLRTHNIEHEYYDNLAQYSNSFFKKLYYKIESNRLERYEKRIAKKIGYVFPLTRKDQVHLKEVFVNSEVRYVSAFYNDKVDVVSPKNYILIQGNFDVEENKYAVDFLLKELIPICPNQSFVFAGKNADKYITTEFKNVTIVSSPSKTQMYALNNEARASIVYSNLNAGVKLKILNSLAAGVPVFCNSSLHIDPYLKLNIQQYSNGTELAKLIQNSDISTISRVERQKSFLATFNMNHSAQKIIDYLMN